MKLKVKNISKKFNSFVAVDNISFEIEKNKVMGLLGPNGCGKTTSIGMMLGLITPTSGKIFINGIVLEPKNRIELLSLMNFASPYIELPKKLTVKQNLEVYARLYGVKEIEQRTSEMIEYLNIQKFLNKKTGELSSGQKTRVSLAKALINKPKLLLLDEPTASLDPVISEYLREFINRYRRNNDISILFSSHNMSEAQKLCDKILILKKGKVLHFEKTRDLLKKNRKKNLEEIYFNLFNK